MITKLPRKGTSALRLLDYLGKDRRGSELLESDLPGATNREQAEQLRGLARYHRPRLKRYVKHMMLSFPPGEQPGAEQARAIARAYLEEMGYGEAPRAVYLHTDTPHHHIHIVTTPVTWAGQRVSESWDWPRSERVARRLERRFNLWRVTSSESARLRAPKQEDLHRAARAGETPGRTLFQVEVAEAAYRARTLSEFLDGLAERGFRVRLLVDRAGVLRGASYERDGLRFKGSQLGRDYQGNHLLTAFGIDYEPGRDGPVIERERRRLEVAAGEARTSGVSGAGAAVPEVPSGDPAAPAGSAHPPAPEAPATAARDIPGLKRPDQPLSLPAGTYQLAAADPAVLETPGRRLGRKDLTWVRKGWGPEQVAKARGWLARENGTRALLVRPDSPDRTVLGFRGVTGQQIAALREAGIEPAWVIRTAQGHDVLLQAHVRLAPDAAEALRTHLVETYGLPRHRGVFRDSVHLPGSHPSPGGEGPRAALVEVRDEPFSASPRLTARLHEATERRQVEGIARSLNLPQDADATPTSALLPTYGDPPHYPETAPLATLQEEIYALRKAAGQQLRSLAEGELAGAAQDLRSLPEAHVARAAREANREVVALAGTVSPEELRSSPPAQRLLALEGELARRLESHRGALAHTEAELRRAAEGEAAAARRLTESLTPESIGEFEAAADRHRGAQPAHAAAEARYRAGLLTQVELDRDRHAAALATADTPEARQALDRLLVQESKLSRQLAEGTAPPVPAEASAEDLQRHLEGASLRARAAGEALRREGPSLLGPFVEARREEVATRLYFDRAQLREAAAASHERLTAALQSQHGRQSLDAALADQGVLSDLARYENHFAGNPANPAEGLRQAALRVARGDFSAEALRRLNATILATEEGRHLHPPVAARAPRQIDPLVGRYAALRSTIAQRAGRVADAPRPPTRAQLGDLLQRSAEAVRVHQRLESVQRRLLGLAAPGRPPRGVSHTAWNLAWVQRAATRGLAPRRAAAHLANLATVPVTSAGLLTTSRLAWALYYSARIAGSIAWRWARRVLSQ